VRLRRSLCAPMADRVTPAAAEVWANPRDLLSGMPRSRRPPGGEAALSRTSCHHSWRRGVPRDRPGRTARHPRNVEVRLPCLPASRLSHGADESPDREACRPVPEQLRHDPARPPPRRRADARASSGPTDSRSRAFTSTWVTMVIIGAHLLRLEASKNRVHVGRRAVQPAPGRPWPPRRPPTPATRVMCPFAPAGFSGADRCRPP